MGWDLARLWAARRWRFLLNLVDHLPRTSHLAAAIADDDELAENTPEPKPGPPPLQDWSAEVERLTLIADRLGEVIAAIYNSNSKKKTKPPRPLRRPVTARDRAARRTRRRKHELVLARVRQAAAEGRPTMAEPVRSTDDRYAAARQGRKGRTPKPRE